MSKTLDLADEREWGNAKQVLAQFGLARSTLIKLADAGKIQSVRLVLKTGSPKGVRLFRIESIRALLTQKTETS
jgi:hypothetical protein